MPRCARAAAGLLLTLVATSVPASAQALDPFADYARTYEVSGSYLVETWNKNLSSEQLAAATFTAGANWAPGWQAVTEFVLGRGMLARSPDPTYVGVTGGVRRRLFGRGGTRVYVDALFGIAVANRHLPDNGTSFNWIAQGGGGVLWPLAGRAYAVSGVRVFHLSNAGLQGHDRNPDIEAIGGHVGVGWGF